MKSLGEAMDKLLINIGLAPVVYNHRVIKEWEQIVGSAIAKIAEPEEVAYNRLIVRVKSPAWRYELKHQKQRILRKIHRRVKGAKINDIIFK